MIILFILIVLAVILLGGAYYAYRVAFYASPEGRDKAPVVRGTAYDPYREEMRRIYRALKERPFETVTVTSHDGLTLSGRYYHTRDGAPLDLCFHGYRSSALTDFSGGCELCFELGHNVLLIDERAHGASEGRTIAFGIKERRDVLTWVQFCLNRFGPDVKIILQGVSMGGATVLMASEFDLPLNVRGIIADCPFSRPMDVILHVGKSMPIPDCLIRPFVTLGARIYGGFDINEMDAFRAVEKAKLPILILHGESDSYVPCTMSEVQNCNRRMVQRHTFPDAEHGISYLVDKPRYQKIVREFLDKCL